MTADADDPAAMAAGLPDGPLIGIDLGEKTIGLAVSDVRRRIASPLEALRRRKFAADAEALRGIAAARGARGFVMGLPLNMDGSQGARAQASRAYGRRLARTLALPVAFWDERLSTAAVQRPLIAADASRRRRAAVVDKMAAAYILQGALDRIGWASGAGDSEEGAANS